MVSKRGSIIEATPSCPRILSIMLKVWQVRDWRQRECRIQQAGLTPGALDAREDPQACYTDTLLAGTRCETAHL